MTGSAKCEGRLLDVTVSDREAISAFFELSRLVGITPAIESSHAVAHVVRMGRDGERGRILVSLSGRGDRDIDFVVEIMVRATVSSTRFKPDIYLTENQLEALL